MNTLMMITNKVTYMVQYEHINDDNKQSMTYMYNMNTLMMITNKVSMDIHDDTI